MLPDGYEVLDPSLNDIKYLLSPTFKPSLLYQLSTGLQSSVDLSKNPYLPGFVGLNNIKANDFMNVIIHSLSQVIPLRNYLVLNSPKFYADNLNENDPKSELLARFSLLMRKIWNPKMFKRQVSPHEFLQEVSNRSEKRFRLTEQGDPVEFLGWLLNTLHKDLGGTKKPKSSECPFVLFISCCVMYVNGFRLPKNLSELCRSCSRHHLLCVSR